MIRAMRAADIDGAMRLKEAARWNQTALDWERLLRLEPHGCFVDARAGMIAGTATALRHGSGLAWIGMVLVLPKCRRRGIARALMAHSLDWLRERGHRAVGLDATDMGRPLYLDLGFRDREPIERWERSATARQSAKRPARSPGPWSQAHAALDRAACGFDRRELLLDLSRDQCVEGVRSETGFGFGRPGSQAWFLGPCVAATQREAAALLAELLRGHEGERVFWDLPPSNPSAARLAAGMGFRRARRLARMMRAETGGYVPTGRADQVYAAAGFEFG